MKRKLLSVFMALVGVLGIALSFLFSASNVLEVKAASKLAISMYGKTYEAPCHIYVGYFDYQEDKAFIEETKYQFVNKEKIEYYPYYCVEDEDSYNFFVEQMKIHMFLVEREAYDLYEEEALSSTFLLIGTSSRDFEPGEELNGCTANEIKRNYPKLIDVVSPDQFDLECSLADVVEPEFQNYEAVYITSIDNPVTVDEIKKTIGATDNVDGDITNRILVCEDNYTEATKTIGGTYSVKFEVKDTAENRAEITIHIKVEDITGPVFDGPQAFEINTTDNITAEDVKDTLCAEDNVDGEVPIYLYSDKYSTKAKIPGTYELVFYAKDTAGNKTFHTVTMTVLDTDIPTISGPQSYTKDTNAYLTTAHIMSKLAANDPSDGDITRLITVKNDGYSGHENEVGEYIIIFTVKDSCNNKSEDFLVTVTVKDTELPIFYVDSSLINLSEYDKMTHDEIVSFLLDSNDVKKSVKKAQFICDEYSKNADQPGTYQVSVRFTYEDGTEEIMNLSLKVHKAEVDQDAPQEVVEEIAKEKVSLFQRLVNFFNELAKKLETLLSNFWVWIKNLF